MAVIKNGIGQINVGRAKYPLDDPKMADFVDNLDRINALADRMDGFIWRLQSDQGNATDILLTSDPLALLNVSVWRDAQSLHRFVYHPEHAAFIKRRHEWFEPAEDIIFALWLQPIDQAPSPEQAYARLQHLRDHGASEHAFGWKDVKRFMA